MAQTIANPQPHPYRYVASSAVAETTTADDVGKLVLRLAVSILIMLHGVAKLNTGLEPIMGMLQSHGLPPELAYGVYLGEIIAPLFVLIGVWTRASAWFIVINMLFAVGLAHLGDLAKLGPQGGWALELQGLYLFGALAIALMGAGTISAAGRYGRWN